MKLTFKNITMYILGLFIIGFGVIIMKKANLGLGSWDAVNYSLEMLLNTTMGLASIIVNAVMMLFVIIYNKSFKYLVVIVTFLLGGLFIDLWELVILKNMVVNSLLYQVFLTLIGVLIIPFGLSLVIFSTLPKGIFDEVTYSLMNLFKIKSFGLMRIIYELFAVVIALILGYFAGIGIGEVGFGTILIALFIGPLINFYLNRFEHKKNPN